MYVLCYANSMKFCSLLSLSGSVLCSASLVCGGLLSCNYDASPASKNVEKISKMPAFTELMPDLQFVIDTIVFAGKNDKRTAGGVFEKYKNKARVYYRLLPDSLMQYKKWCDDQNAALRVVSRHELEHARKVAMVQTKNELPGFYRAQVVIMNECMAPAAEIIEAMVYRMETGERFPVDRRFLFAADSLIMQAHGNRPMPIDFSRNEIADIVLDLSVDKFIKDYNGGTYHHSVRLALGCAITADFTPHKKCDKYTALNYNPVAGIWGGLWTFDITSYQEYLSGSHLVPVGTYNFGAPCPRVDIWNSATRAARERALSKVYNCIKQEMKGGQMLYRKTFEQIRYIPKTCR